MQLQTNAIPDDVRITQFRALERMERIAEGGFGIIYRAQHTQWGTVAYKELKSTVINPKDKIAQELQKEVQAHVLRHQNVIAVISVIFEPNHYGVVLEYALHGGLDTFIDRYEVEWITKLSLASGVVQGMTYLHMKNPPVIHGDLKLQNVLVADGYVAKICDFGLSKWRQYSAIRTPSRTVRATVTHIPPENWSNINQPRTPKYDMYSFGIMLWELLSEKAPYGDASSNADLIRIAVTKDQRPNLDDIDEKQLMPDGLRDWIKDSVSRYWAQQPEERPSFGGVMEIFREQMTEYEEQLEVAKRRLDMKVQEHSSPVSSYSLMN
jgi:serine/threonine protein kinase